MPTIMLFGDSNIEDGKLATALRDNHGYTPVGSQEKPTGVFHEGYKPNRNSHDMVVNAGFPLHPRQTNNFENNWISGSPLPADIPDYVVVAFGTNWLRRWVSNTFGDDIFPVEIAASNQGAILSYFKRIWPTTSVVATLFVNGNSDAGHANWAAYEADPYNAPVGTGRAYWNTQRDLYKAEFEARHAGKADFYVRADLTGTEFTDDVHPTDAGFDEYAQLIDNAINGLGDFIFPIIPSPNTCIVYARAEDFETLDFTAAKLRVEGPTGGFFHGNTYIAPNKESPLSGDDGEVQLAVAETATISRTVTLKLMIGSTTALSAVVTIPNQGSVNAKDLLAP